MSHRCNRYLAVASRVVRRSLKEDLRLQAERRGEMDLRFAKWEVSSVQKTQGFRGRGGATPDPFGVKDIPTDNGSNRMANKVNLNLSRARTRRLWWRTLVNRSKRKKGMPAEGGGEQT